MPTRVTRTSSGFHLHPRRHLHHYHRNHLAKAAANDGDESDWTGGVAAVRNVVGDEDDDTVDGEDA